jgi:hypothetical protein
VTSSWFSSLRIRKRNWVTSVATKINFLLVYVPLSSSYHETATFMFSPLHVSIQHKPSWKAHAIVQLRNPPNLLRDSSVQSTSSHITSWGSYLSAFTKLWKATIRFVMSVCPSAWNNSAPSVWIFMKCDNWGFF